MNEMDRAGGLPVGLGMALAQNKRAMEKFVSLSEAEKISLIQGTRGIGSPEEMRAYVARLTETS